ncbi:MAG: endolytic transglycosylase MltG [Acidobacteriota bacterium]|nr:endolytic transglycosylase MltG [Acidobacteriota bacterium]
MSLSARSERAREARLRERERAREGGLPDAGEWPARAAAGPSPRRGRAGGPQSGGPRDPRRPSRWPLWAAAGSLVLALLLVIVIIGRRGSGGAGGATRPRAVVNVVVPEGLTRAQIAAIARRDRLSGSYLAASTRQPLLDPVAYGAPRGTPHLEGFLYPATYQLYAGGSATTLVADQLEAFREHFGPAQLAAARSLGITPYQLLIVASMIEREAGIARDRPLIAAVIYNRLHRGMPLGIDATLRYALGDFTRPLTEAQLATPSPYNTRLHRGLPPTPISNPGAEAIEAATHPAHAGYLYYVAGADGCGESVFSDTYAAFLENVAAYRRALSANGGHVPACHRR